MTVHPIHFYILVGAVLLFSCNQNHQKGKIGRLTDSTENFKNKVRSDNSNAKTKPIMYILQRDAKKLLYYFINDQFDSIIPFIHPTKGIRIVPMVRIENYHPVFTRDSIHLKMQNDSIFWGYGDGSGLPIYLSWKKYKKTYITNRNYLEVDPILSEIPAHFTLTEQNIQSFFRDSYIEDFTVNLNEDHDWGSVIFVFEKWENHWFCCGLLSNYWTI